jgi:hypothetical protein
MAFPSTIDIFPGTAAQGTSLLTSPDHGLDHRTLGSALGTVEQVIGTTAGTYIAKNFVAGDFAARINSGGTLQQILTGTVNNSVMGSPTVTGGTINNVLLGTPNINGGTLGTALLQGGTISNPLVTTYTIGSAAYSPAVSGTVTLDLTKTRHLINLPNTGNVTISAPAYAVNTPFFIEALQGTTGNGTIVWFATLKWSGGTPPTQTFTPNKKDTLGFVTTGTAPSYDGYIVGVGVA